MRLGFSPQYVLKTEMWTISFDFFLSGKKDCLRVYPVLPLKIAHYLRPMNLKLSAWFHAFRLRTLPLAFSSIIAGSFAAYRERFDWLTFGLALVTTLLLQILSNLANDFGDSEKGADNDRRIGPKRAVQAGLLSSDDMKKGILFAAILAFLCGLWLVLHALGGQLQTLFFIALGIAAIIAAVKYTVGKSAYGYHGLGDVFVLFFFGIVGVAGSYFLHTKMMNYTILLLGLAVGCFATAVLNLNNMRDCESDAASGKNTLVVKIGGAWAKLYHTVLIATAVISSFAYLFETALTWVAYLPVLTYPVFLLQNRQIQKIEDPKNFDPFLKKTALTAFVFSLLLAIGQILSTFN